MLIDLTMLVNEKTVAFPGDALPVFEPVGTFENTFYVDHVLHINNHLGTHIDAPGHMVEGGKMLQDYPVDRFVREAVCVDARGKDLLTADVLDGIDVQPDMVVLLYTGCGDFHTEQRYATDYPTIDESLANKLIDLGVSMVGADIIGFDTQDGAPIHKLLLGKDVLLIENLVNLNEVMGKRFTLYALPINLELHAAPARVIAALGDM